MVLAMPAMAQVASLTGPTTIIEHMDCTGDNEIKVKLNPASSRATSVHVFAITQRGPDIFRSAPAAQMLEGHDNNTRISSGGPVIIPAGSSAPVNTGICWRNDIIDSGSGSVVQIVIANGPGYTVHPTEGRLDINIAEDDDCADPADGMFGEPNPRNLVWKENPNCRCATESTHPSVRWLGSQSTTITRRDNTTETYTLSDEVYQQALSNLASHFSDPSYLYCPESPWKGLP